MPSAYFKIFQVLKMLAVCMRADDSTLIFVKETRSVTMKIFRKKYFLCKSFEKIELSYIFTINMVSIAKTARKGELSFLKECFFSDW